MKKFYISLFFYIVSQSIAMDDLGMAVQNKEALAFSTSNTMADSFGDVCNDTATQILFPIVSLAQCNL